MRKLLLGICLFIGLFCLVGCDINAFLTPEYENTPETETIIEYIEIEKIVIVESIVEKKVVKTLSYCNSHSDEQNFGKNDIVSNLLIGPEGAIPTSDGMFYTGATILRNKREVYYQSHYSTCASVAKYKVELKGGIEIEYKLVSGTIIDKQRDPSGQITLIIDPSAVYDLYEGIYIITE